MDLLDRISLYDTWTEFYEYKIAQGNMSCKEADELRAYIDNRRYEAIVDSIINESYEIPVPVRCEINKLNSSKKRIVYTYPYDFSNVLKIIAYCLHVYDNCFANGCLAFRRDRSFKSVIGTLKEKSKESRLYAIKTDISNYFNSIDVDILCGELSEVLVHDKRLFAFCERMLRADKAFDTARGCEVCEKRGAMAGIPVASFFANVYLRKLDREFEKRGILYYRYSDDILIMTRDEKSLNEIRSELYDRLREYGLEINVSKEDIIVGKKPIDFLGLSILDGDVDLSFATKEKLKGKIKRKAKSIRRWCDKKSVSYEKGAKVLIKSMNRKFYSVEDDDFSWSRWFFPVITTSQGLKQIDAYMQDYVRFCITGRHNKGNYRIRYSELKKLGYISLVNKWYGYKRTGKYEN